MGKKVLLAGATGLVGSHLLEMLLQSSPVEKVQVLTRRPLECKHAKIDVCQVDFQQLDQWPDPVDTVVCALGTTIKKAGSREAFRKVDYHYPLALGKIAKAAGAEMLLVSSIGADAATGNFYLRTKGEVEEALKALNLKGLALLRPSLMHEGRSESRPGEKIAGAGMALFGWLLVGPLRNYRAIHPGRVAFNLLKLVEDGCAGVQVLESAQLEARGTGYDQG